MHRLRFTRRQALARNDSNKTFGAAYKQITTGRTTALGAIKAAMPAMNAALANKVS